MLCTCSAICCCTYTINASIVCEIHLCVRLAMCVHNIHSLITKPQFGRTKRNEVEKKNREHIGIVFHGKGEDTMGEKIVCSLQRTRKRRWIDRYARIKKSCTNNETTFIDGDLIECVCVGTDFSVSGIYFCWCSFELPNAICCSVYIHMLECRIDFVSCQIEMNTTRAVHLFLHIWPLWRPSHCQHPKLNDKGPLSTSFPIHWLIRKKKLNQMYRECIGNGERYVVVVAETWMSSSSQSKCRIEILCGKN